MNLKLGIVGEQLINQITGVIMGKKKYATFKFDRYYPEGGADDFVGFYTMDEVLSLVEALRQDETIQIADRETLKSIRSWYRDSNTVQVFDYE